MKTVDFVFKAGGTLVCVACLLFCIAISAWSWLNGWEDQSGNMLEFAYTMSAVMIATFFGMPMIFAAEAKP